MVFVLELKINVSGFTAMFMPDANSTLALYLELIGPTFVTVLVRTVGFLRFGIVMDGRFTSRIDGCLEGQTTGCSVSWKISELL